jgi:hypothetical protein
MSTSQTYAFSSSLQSEQLINDAYERIGVIPAMDRGQQIVSAQRTLNFILQEWATKGNNLFTIQTGMIGLYANQYQYNIPAEGIDLKTVSLRQSNRVLDGTPFTSAGGVAANAFDGNTATACTQSAPDGYIAYIWSEGTGEAGEQMITLVGIQSEVDAEYTLNLDTSDGTFPEVWTTRRAIPIQSYPAGEIQWFTVFTPASGFLFRIKEIGGATLNIQELYFNDTVTDYLITRMSEFEYNSQSSKTQNGRPTSFYVDRQIVPILYLWPVPGNDVNPITGTTALNQYNCLYFTYWKTIEDVGAMIDSAAVPARFLEPLCAALAFRLAIKNQREYQIPLETISLLGQLAEQSYMTAKIDDRERVPFRVIPDLGYSLE